MMDGSGYGGREPRLFGKLGELHWGLVTILVVLAGAGVAMLYSVVGGAWNPYASAHAIRFAVGLGILVLVAMIDLRLWKSLAYPAYGLALALLVGVEFIGVSGKGATRWIDLGPISLQPSEVMKIALIIALARLLMGRSKAEVNHPFILLPALAMILAPVVLVAHQPDLGTAVLLFAGGGAILFLAGLSWWYLGAALAVGIATIPVAWRVLKDYQKDRVLTFLNPDRDPMGAGYHTLQSKIGLGSGGLVGKGFLNSSQARLDFLPEKQTDFIFTILGEEFGFLGTFTILCLYGIILSYGVSIAFSSRSQFGRLVAMGICMTFLFYVAINTAMVVGLVPVVGVPLPLISYGGTAMMTIMFGMGLIMSVHVHRGIDIGR
jgi:rod shape determining protein RodA